MSLPPGPRNALAATVRYLRDPFSTLLAMADRYGDPFTWPTFLGRVIVTGDPQGIRDILSGDPAVYSALGAELLAPVIGENNLDEMKLVLASVLRAHTLRLIDQRDVRAVMRNTTASARTKTRFASAAG